MNTYWLIILSMLCYFTWSQAQAQLNPTQMLQGVISCLAIWDVSVQAQPKANNNVTRNTSILVWLKLIENLDAHMIHQLNVWKHTVSQALQTRLLAQPVFLQEILHHAQECDHILQLEVSTPT